MISEMFLKYTINRDLHNAQVPVNIFTENLKLRFCLRLFLLRNHGDAEVGEL